MDTICATKLKNLITLSNCFFALRGLHYVRLATKEKHSKTLTY